MPDLPSPDWSLTRQQTYTLFIIGFLIGAIAIPVVATHLSNTSEISGGVTLNASATGPTVTVTGTTDADLRTPFPDANTVDLDTEAGNITITSTGETNATIHQTEITGPWTNVTDIDTNSNDLTLNPEDKDKFTVGKDINAVNVSNDIAADDNSVDFVYNGTTGQTSKVVVRGLQADTFIAAIDPSTNAVLDDAKTDGSGKLVLDNLDNSKHTVTLKSGQADPTFSNPTPEGAQNTFPTTLTVDVDDGDFPNEEVDVEFFLDGNSVGTDTVTSQGGTASVTISKPTGGDHDVRVKATDSYGNTNQLNYSFSTPSNVTIREARDPWSVIDDRQVNLTFYQSDTVLNRTTSNGNVSLDGLNLNEQIVIEAETRGFNDSHIVIRSLSEQSTIYMLNDSATTRRITFFLNDLTGGTFSNNNASLFIKRPVNHSNTGPDPVWRTIYADEFAVDGVTTDLQQGQRYRLVVENDQGDTRLLGKYTPTENESATLTVSAVTTGPPDPAADYTYNASYVNSSSSRHIKFQFNDTENSTTSVTVQIHEQGNASNVIFTNTTFGGPLGTVGITQPISQTQSETDWVVKFWVESGGSTNRVVVPVGPQQPILNGIPWYLLTIISVGSIWVVAGLFSQVNGDVGAVVVAGMGAMYWFVDFVPDGVGFGVILLSMITAGIIFIHERRGASI